VVYKDKYIRYTTYIPIFDNIEAALRFCAEKRGDMAFPIARSGTGQPTGTGFSGRSGLALLLTNMCQTAFFGIGREQEP
jgi:hypothetical protein